MELKNIVIINDYSYVDGGASEVAIMSAVKLSQMGLNVILFSAVLPVDVRLTNSNVKVININQYDILNNPNRLSAFIQGIWNKKSEIEFGKLLKTLSIENTVIHVHTWTKALSSSVINVAIKRKFKVILTLHEYFTVCPNGGFFNYNTEKICHLKPMSIRCALSNCDYRHYYHKIWRMLRQYNQMKKGLVPTGIKNYIYISELSKKVLTPFLPSGANYYYVKDPVDIKADKPVDVIKNNTFVYIGRLSKEKGCLLFAEAARKLNIKAVFIGDGALKREITQIYPKARVTGWLNKNEVNTELKNARALIFPSLWYETLGLTALEAQVNGVPVIVSDTCAAREIVKDGKTGLWFKRNNLQDLQEKIKLMLDDKKAEYFGKNAFNEYLNNDYGIDNHVMQIKKVYEDILERG